MRPRAPSEERRPSSAWARRAGLVAGAVTLLWLLLALWRTSFPPLPSPLILEVRFPAGIAGRCEPLVTTGLPGDGDFLAVRFLDEHNAVLLYDVWGVGGPTSHPFAVGAGQRRRLEIEMPTLAPVDTVKSHERRLLRVALDGEELLNEAVYFHRRDPAAIALAANPIGGSLVQKRFRGTVAFAGGNPLKGGPANIFGWPERLTWIFRNRMGAVVLRIGASILVGFVAAGLYPRAVRALRWVHATDAPTAHIPVRTDPPHAWFLLTAGVCTLAFTAMITNGTFRLLAPDTFGHFYDYQALSLLEGRLDLPTAAHSSESFVVADKHYIYFGPTPAVLRLPFVWGNVAFGLLSRAFMVAYYVAFLGAIYALLIHVARRATRVRSWPSPFAVLVFVTTAGLGSTAFFLSSRAYVYHEAILCGLTFALWSGYFSLRYLAEPERGWWAGAVACGLAAVHARPTTGLFALSLVGTVAVLAALREIFCSDAPRALLPPTVVHRRWQDAARHLLVALCAMLAFSTFAGLSYLKFGSFEGAPLKYHVQYQGARLARIDGRNFHLANLGFNLDTYLRGPGLSPRSSFPFLALHGTSSDAYPDAKVDLAEPTAALPYSMPALLLLAVGGSLVAVLRWPEARVPLAVVGFAALPMALALFTAVAVSQRYTADFCPALILAAAFGMVEIERLPPRWISVGRTALALLCAFSAAITVAMTLLYQGEIVWGVPDAARARYQSLRSTVDTFFGANRP